MGRVLLPSEYVVFDGGSFRPVVRRDVYGGQPAGFDLESGMA